MVNRRICPSPGSCRRSLPPLAGENRIELAPLSSRIELIPLSIDWSASTLERTGGVLVLVTPLAAPLGASDGADSACGTGRGGVPGASTLPTSNDDGIRGVDDFLRPTGPVKRTIAYPRARDAKSCSVSRTRPQDPPAWFHNFGAKPLNTGG
eukprot:4365683-Prymnesium_polylepis.2